MKLLSIWKEKLGLMPVPLFATEKETGHYVMLNGNFGNFCLDLKHEKNLAQKACDYAWSSNVGSYIQLFPEDISVYRWDRGANSIENYKRKSVETNIEKFYEYIQENQPRRDLSIIAHSIKIFRTLRNILGDKVKSEESLQGFLYLLACLHEGASQNDLPLSKWGFPEKVRGTIKLIDAVRWETLSNEFSQGIIAVLISQRPAGIDQGLLV